MSSSKSTLHYLDRFTTMTIRSSWISLPLLCMAFAIAPVRGQSPNEPLPERPAADAPASLGRTIQVDTAQVVSLHKIQVAAQSDGLIQELLVDEGHEVKKGDTLLVIDNRLAIAELGVATKEAEAAAKQAAQTAEVEYAETASAVADAEYAEIYALHQKGAAAYSEARRKQLEKDRARLGIDVANVKHEQEILAAQVAQEKVSAAEVRLGLFKVIAPYDGIIVQRLRDQGEWIRAGEPVLRLVHMHEMKVETLVEVRGIAINRLQGAPMRVTVKLDPQTNATYTPVVEFVSPEIEAHRVRISARIQNEMLGGVWLLRDGMTASIEIQLPE